MENTWRAQVCLFSIRVMLVLIYRTGEDLAINLWDLGSGRRIKQMAGHTASIYSLAFSAESNLLVSGGADWTVRCWDVKGAGGLAGKSRENGVNGINGKANGDVASSRDQEDIEPNIET